MIMSPPPLLAAASTWLTPLWLLAAGAAIGVAILAIAYGLMWLVSRDASAQVAGAVGGGILLPIGYVAVVMTVLMLVGSMYVPYRQFADSLARLPSVGEISREVTVPPRTVDHPVQVSFYSNELGAYRFAGNQDVVIATQPLQGEGGATMLLAGGEPVQWNRGSGRASGFEGPVTTLYVTNNSDAQATLEVDLATQVPYPEVIAVPITAASLVGLFAVYLGLYFAFPKLSAIATTTAKEAISQPIYYLALGLGACLLIAFVYIPYNTFGEDVKMLESSALSLILVLSIVVAVWTASVSVSDEIEGRTALTLLSKPIGRRQFVLGKFLGIIWPTVLLFVLLGLLLMGIVSYKVVFEAHEAASEEPAWQQCFAEMVRIVPALVLYLMEAIVLVAVSVAISTRLPMLPNLIICSSLYVLGHLVPTIVQSQAGQFEIVAFIGRLLATLIPVLDHFNVEAAVSGGNVVPLAYLPWALAYCVLYSTIAMLLALAMFEDRDLA
ncbi:MAG: ABC transporter permease subunit [Pirellulales bacterium]